MSPEKTLEQRLAALETAVAEIQRRLGLKPASERWWEKIIGLGGDNPDFDKMVQYGQEIRQADRPPEDEE